MSNTEQPTTPAVLPANTPSYSYQVGVSQLMQVLIDFQKDLRYVALEPDQALTLAGHLKRVANLAIVARKKAKAAATLGDRLKREIAERAATGSNGSVIVIDEYSSVTTAVRERKGGATIDKP
jgi:hypothetical protein